MICKEFGFFLLLGFTSASLESSGLYRNDRVLTENLLREVVGDLADAYFDIPEMEEPQKIRDAARTIASNKEFEGVFDYSDINSHPSIRDHEYLQHSSLWGHRYPQGGANEGKQLLKSEGQMKSQSRPDAGTTLPAYCNPPNPCPLEYTEEDGCTVDFQNTAEFSRIYQASQECMCDAEHMYECPQETDAPRNDIDYSAAFMSSVNTKKNPFLQGEMLPIAAKKGNHVLQFSALQ